MPTLAEYFNASTDLAFEGKRYPLRQPTQLEQGMFQRWLEQRAYDAIERRTYQDPSQQAEDRRLLNRDIAAGVYEYGGHVCAAALATPIGIAKQLSIVCRDDGLDFETAKRMVDLQIREIAAVFAREATDDPKALAATLSRLNLPSDYFSRNSRIRRSTGRSKNSRKRRTRN